MDNRAVFRLYIIEKIKFFSLLAVAATLPTKWVNLNSIAIIVLCIASGVDFYYGKRKLNFNPWVLFSFISFFVLTVLSFFYTTNFQPLFSKIETRLTVLVFPLILFTTPITNRKALNLVMATFLISCIAISVLCLVWIFYANLTSGVKFTLSQSWFFSSDNLVERWGFHPNYFSIYCSFCVFILIHFWKEDRISAFGALILIVYLFVFEVFLASRVGILSFAFVFTITIIYEFYIRRRLLHGLCFSLLASVVIFFISMNSRIVKDKFDALLNRNVDVYNEPFRVNRRFIQWESALMVIRQSPIIGVGVGDMQDELQKIYLEKEFKEGFEYAYNPHNLFLDTGASLGIVGVASNVILFLFSAILAVRQKSILYLQFLILFILMSLVESTFSVQKGVTFFFLFNTLFYCSLTCRELNERQKIQ